MMPILTKEEAKTLMEKVLSYSKADECEVNLSGSNGGNIRYARNAVSTSGSIARTSLVVQSSFGKKAGVATINEYDEESLKKVVARAEELARLAPENPEHMPVLGPQDIKEGVAFFDSTAKISAKQRADATASSLEIVKKEQLVAAGFMDNNAGFTALMNSKGLFAYSTSSSVEFNVTVRTENGKGSGYASIGQNDFTKLDVAGATRVAAQKAKTSVDAKAIEPGKYTVILEPGAALSLMETMFFAMDGRSADEGRSFLSLPGGKTRLGEQLVDKRVNIYSDPWNKDLPSQTWSGDGRPQERVSWIENGVVKNLTYSRYWAQKKGVKAVPQPGAVIMEGGTASLEELIRGTEKGILVSRLYYIREVDPQTLLNTGLTRDGTFYIENGQIKYPVKNFRFNESAVIMLNNIEALGKPERAVSGESGWNGIIPPMKIREFTFTSLSDAV
ncbi:MAG: TldD/PmbA family protein [Chitinophagaceae bacterium]|nr:MAG: TldD/PmbA family protein [Chitinophagaceae bacterium]